MVTMELRGFSESSVMLRVTECDGRADKTRVGIAEEVPVIALDPCLRFTPVGSTVVGDLALGREAGPHIWPLAPLCPSVLLPEIDGWRVLATCWLSGQFLRTLFLGPSSSMGNGDGLDVADYDIRLVIPSKAIL
jgi:hypothetical protein